MNSIRVYFPFSYVRFRAEHAARAAMVMVGIFAVAYVYFTVSAVNLSFRAHSEWQQIEAAVVPRHELERAYARKLDEMRLTGGAAFGLLAPFGLQYLESFSSVARAGL